MDWLVAVPVLAYAAVSLVRARAGRGGIWPAVALWGVLAIAATVLFARLPALAFYPGNDALRRMVGESSRLRANGLKKTDVILLIEGSSAVTADVKPAELERRLRERGLPARVVQISSGGSNHFERVAMLREFLRTLNSDEAKVFRKARVFLLAEVLYVYDFLPLHGFAENAFSARSVGYATPRNFLPMLRAIWAKGSRDDPAALALAPLVTEHVLFHAFRVGTFPLVAVPVQTYSANGTGDRDASAPANRGGKRRALSDSTQLPYPWWHASREALEDAVDGWVDAAGYLAPPARADLEPLYQAKFAAALPADTLQISGVEARPLLGPEQWRDAAHLNARGADTFTAWLAARIAADWPRISGEPKK
ncbi:MAG TPA: hypothetical protein VIM61_08655 [Chthoniobacterales bacterium]|jgi:hypothetical protein